MDKTRRNLKIRLLALAVGLSLLASVGTYTNVNGQGLELQHIDVDLSNTANPNDFPFGIECGDPNFVYMTIFNQGLLAKVDKVTHAVQLIDDPDFQGEPSGQEFYGIARDPNTGNLFNNEVDNGKMWRFEPASSTWTRIPILPKIQSDMTTVTYPFTYPVKPNTLTIDESFAGLGDVAYGFNVPSRGTVVFANNFIWTGLTFNIHFDDAAHSRGIQDQTFSGLARIDPSSLQVTLIPIPNSVVIAGLSVDSINPAIIWIADFGGDQLFAFDSDPNTLKVVQTIPISAPTDSPTGLSSPNIVATNANRIFVALAIDNGLGNPGVFSEIAEIDRSAPNVVNIINTTAPNTIVGTFTVFVVNDILIWTDQSSHVGTIDISTNPPTVHPPQTTDFSFGNHFGCLANPDEFWFAAQGTTHIGRLSKFSGGRPVTGSDPCTGTVVINSTTAANAPKNIDYRASGCVILDDEPPKIVRAFVTPGDWVCVEAHDNVATMSVTYNDRAIPPWPGSLEHFCTNEELPPIIEVVAKDAAGNISKMVAINVRQIVTTGTEQTFSAIVSKELNPHKDIEGMVLMSKEPIKQIRIGASPEFADQRFLQLSDIAIQELNGQHTIVVKYYGQHVDRKGQLYVFAVNRGLLATFDVAVDGNDMKLSLHQEKALHQPYDLKLDNINVIDNMRLNAWQKAEFENALQNDGKLTLTQTNVLSMVLRLASTSH